MKTRLLSLWFLLLFVPANPQATVKSGATHPKTVIKNKAAKTKLLGEHRLSLDWISREHFGKAIVTESNGTLFLKGDQRAIKGNDYLIIDGIITVVYAREFKFNGTIFTKVSINKGGTPCERKGEMTFTIKGNRRYWRLKEMGSPCDVLIDHIDIYFR